MSCKSELETTTGGAEGEGEVNLDQISNRSSRKPAYLTTCLEKPRKFLFQCKHCNKKCRGRKKLRSHMDLDHQNLLVSSIPQPCIPTMTGGTPSVNQVTATLSPVRVGLQKPDVPDTRPTLPNNPEDDSNSSSRRPVNSSSTFRKSVYKTMCLEQPRKFYWCKNCNERCLGRRNLTSHVMQHHSKRKSASSTQLSNTTLTSPSPVRRRFKVKPTSHACGTETKKTQGQRGNYECMFCNKVFSYTYLLEKHMVVHTKEKAFQCQKCKISFGWESYLATHMRTHSDNDMRCHHCPLLFATARHLKIHVKKVHARKLISAKTDPETLVTKPQIHGNSQLRPKESPKNRYNCSKCNKPFQWPSLLRRHMLTHVQRRPTFDRKNHQNHINFDSSNHVASPQPPSHQQNFKVTITGNLKEFNVKVKLPSSNVNAQSVNKTFPCSFCDKSFYCNSTLRDHILTHSQMKGFNCFICKRIFRHKQEFSGHVKRPHVINCDRCALTFSMERHLKEHTSSVHCDESMKPENFSDTDPDPAMPRLKRFDESPEPESPKPVPLPVSDLKPLIPALQKCQVCGNEFPSKASLQQHFWTHVEGMHFPCLRCELKFPSKQLLEQHCSAVHCFLTILKCQKCDLSFTNKTLLQVHSLTHAANDQVMVSVMPNQEAGPSQSSKTPPVKPKEKKEHICPYCFKRFSVKQSLQLHTAVHTNVKPYKCSTCPAAFARSDRLKNHLKTHEKKLSVKQPDHMKLPNPVKVSEAPHKEILSCEQCGKHFFREETLKSHLSVHEGIATIQCTQCNKDIPFSQINTHMLSHVPK